MTNSLEKLNHLTVYHVNVEGDLAKAAFLKKLANGNLTNNKSRIAPPSAIITTETWVTDQHKIALLGKKWFSHFSQHPSSSGHKVRGQGGICIRVKKQPYWDIHPITLPPDLTSPDHIFVSITTKEGAVSVLGGVYLPSTGKPTKEVENRFTNSLDILTKAIAHIRKAFSPHTRILLGGDFNCRLGAQVRDHHTNTKRAAQFNRMLTTTGLSILLSSTPNPYTFVRHTRKGKNVKTSKSVIDLFLTSHHNSAHPSTHHHKTSRSVVHQGIDFNTPHKLISCAWNPGGLHNLSQGFEWETKPKQPHTFHTPHIISTYKTLTQDSKTTTTILNRATQLSQKTREQLNTPDTANDISTLTSDFLHHLLDISTTAHGRSTNKKVNPTPSKKTTTTDKTTPYKPTTMLDHLIHERETLLTFIHSDPNLKPSQTTVAQIATLTAQINNITEKERDEELRQECDELTKEAENSNSADFFQLIHKMLNNRTSTFPTSLNTD